MNDVEARLRDALDARAAAVRTDPEAYAAVVRRRDRRRVRRWSAAVAAGLAVPALAVVVAVAAPQRVAGPAGNGAANRPAVAAGVEDGRVVFAETESFDEVASWAPTGQWQVVAVATAGDGRRFYASVVDTTYCRSDVFFVTLDPAGDRWVVSATPVDGLTGVAARIGGLDVTRDGTRLAYVARPVAQGTRRCTNDGEVRVRDLATGTERVWDDGRPADAFPFDAVPRWAPEGRLLSLGIEWEPIDTHAPATTVARDRTQWVVVGDDYCHESSHAFLRGGDLVAMLDCSEAGLPSGVYVVDGRTNYAKAPLFAPPGPPAADSLVLDASGDHVLLRSAAAEGGAWTWSRDTGVREVGGAAARAFGWVW